jgi:hypothetical protein
LTSFLQSEPESKFLDSGSLWFCPSTHTLSQLKNFRFFSGAQPLLDIYLDFKKKSTAKAGRQAAPEKNGVSFPQPNESPIRAYFPFAALQTIPFL